MNWTKSPLLESDFSIVLPAEEVNKYSEARCSTVDLIPLHREGNDITDFKYYPAPVSTTSSSVDSSHVDGWKILKELTVVIFNSRARIFFDRLKHCRGRGTCGQDSQPYCKCNKWTP